METVNKGILLVGVKSKNHVVFVGFKTTPNEKLSYFPEKLFKVSNHIVFVIAGLSSRWKITLSIYEKSMS